MTSKFESDATPDIVVDCTTVTPRYSVADEQSLNDGLTYLNEHGYAVFSDVMSESDIRLHKDLLWNFLETVPGRDIQRHDSQTWSSNW
jgi:hypothetical protein